MPHTIDRDNYVSTGLLPPPHRVRALIDKVHAHYAVTAEGSIATVYPVLERANPALFGICLVSADGAVYETGDAATEFTIMSISKPFIFALLCREIGAEAAREKLGVNSTGMPFNALSALERAADGRTNPMVNSGAIAATSFIPGASSAERWEFIYEGLCLFAGRKLTLDEDTYANASATNYRNRGIVNALYEAISQPVRICAVRQQGAVSGFNTGLLAGDLRLSRYPDAKGALDQQARGLDQGLAPHCARGWSRARSVPWRRHNRCCSLGNRAALHQDRAFGGVRSSLRKQGSRHPRCVIKIRPGKFPAFCFCNHVAYSATSRALIYINFSRRISRRASP